MSDGAFRAQCVEIVRPEYVDVYAVAGSPTSTFAARPRVATASVPLRISEAAVRYYPVFIVMKTCTAIRLAQARFERLEALE
jgi:hypothetical protein